MNINGLTTCDLADVLPRCQVMDPGLAALYANMGSVAGPAYTVFCPAGDNLMMHAAIYEAPAGSVIVARSEDARFALVGGNVCALAQQRGIAGMVIDGLARDVAEIRALGFPVFARGLCPKPAQKTGAGEPEPTITCAGVEVTSGDLVAADEEGIVVLPAADAMDLLSEAQKQAETAAATSLESWSAGHRRAIQKVLDTQ